MLPEIKKYAGQYHFQINDKLAEKITKENKGDSESCDFTRELYNVPFANFGDGAKLCLGCTVTLLSEDQSPFKNESVLDD